ncbi:hypothetical protein MTR_5g085550 [Medicago truncatula]|uniref:Uncharacterized protein n=1 Tax=Medicago truncatula TaxID=3880 RepID=G7KHB9_MEDTR|nr:hypothetical protein MTR_5g085550 [Medicago truncatula]
MFFIFLKEGRVKFLDFSSIVTHKFKELKADKCYNLTLEPSFKDESSNKYCTLRCEFLFIGFMIDGF